MDEVEESLARHVTSEAAFVTVAARHLMDAGGKRFRPLLVLLAAQFGDPDAWGVPRANPVPQWASGRSSGRRTRTSTRSGPSWQLT